MNDPSVSRKARIGRPPTSPEQRFHSRYVVDADSGCWLWTGALRGGYGRIQSGSQTHDAHRFAYELLVGPIPEGLVIDHLCRVRSCVNPAHMEPVTQRINVLRGESFAATYTAATECVNGHDFTPENTVTRKDGRRQCRTCLRAITKACDQRARLADPAEVRRKDRERQRRSRERRRAELHSSCDNP